MRPLSKLSEFIYSLTRLVVGVTFAQHGAQKLFGAFGGNAVDLGSLLGVAGVIELVGGGLIAVGFYTPWAAFVASGQMASAYAMAHWPRGVWPLENGGEAAILYCVVFLYFASRGSGPVSLDRAVRGRRS